MSTTAIAPKGLAPAPVRKAPRAATSVSAAAAVGERELHRWVAYLSLPFVLAAVFFGLAISTGAQWLMGAAFLGGPEILIGFMIYLMLSSDSNDDV